MVYVQHKIICNLNINIYNHINVCAFIQTPYKHYKQTFSKFDSTKSMLSINILINYIFAKVFYIAH